MEQSWRWLSGLQQVSCDTWLTSQQEGKKIPNSHASSCICKDSVASDRNSMEINLGEEETYWFTYMKAQAWDRNN